jgi:hypothetical protein
MMTADDLIHNLESRLDAVFEDGAGFMADKLYETLGVQAAPLRVTRGGRLRAVEDAEPGAAPRRVSGELQSRVDVAKDGPGHWSFGITKGSIPLKALALELSQGHPYLSRVIDTYGNEVAEIITSRLRS